MDKLQHPRSSACLLYTIEKRVRVIAYRWTGGRVYDAFLGQGEGVRQPWLEPFLQGAVVRLLIWGNYGRHFLSTLLTLILSPLKKVLLFLWAWGCGVLDMAMPKPMSSQRTSFRAFFTPYTWQYYYMNKGKKKKMKSADKWFVSVQIASENLGALMKKTYKPLYWHL